MPLEHCQAPQPGITQASAPPPGTCPSVWDFPARQIFLMLPSTGLCHPCASCLRRAGSKDQHLSLCFPSSGSPQPPSLWTRQIQRPQPLLIEYITYRTPALLPGLLPSSHFQQTILSNPSFKEGYGPPLTNKQTNIIIITIIHYSMLLLDCKTWIS